MGIRDQLHTLLDGIDTVPHVVPDECGETTTTLGDLAKAGALTLRHPVGAADLDAGAAGPFVLTGRDVAKEREPVLGLADEPQLAAGDRRPRPRVVTDPGSCWGRPCTSSAWIPAASTASSWPGSSLAPPTSPPMSLPRRP